jgi:hypothetical protein
VPVSAEEAHEFLKAKFLVRRITNHETGEALERVASTTELDTAQFNEYLDNVARSWRSSVASWSPNRRSTVRPVDRSSPAASKGRRRISVRPATPPFVKDDR